MADEDPYAEYEAGSPELKELIEKELARRNRHQWFQNFMQLLSTASGVTVTLYIIKVTGDVISQGHWETALGGSMLGGTTIVSLARLYINANRTNAIIEGRSRAAVKRIPPAKKAVSKRAQPAKKGVTKPIPPTEQT